MLAIFDRNTLYMNNELIHTYGRGTADKQANKYMPY